ncbi:type ISP restriction/modification enzyme, partial [Bartonella sp. AP36NXGY]|uniref:type ISP restriction/modification enzyme n=1 Tax=Bartonella sp. AP36NXGY TaxID=3243493 RepID=UPI0035D0C939
MPLMNRLNARAVATLGAGKYNDGAGLLLHKRKDGGAQWLYRYTITDEGLAHFKAAYPNEKITKDDLFYYVYGIFHS